MPLRSGYSYATFQANVAEMIASGHTRESAVAAAASAARKKFFRMHPFGALPAWLAYPKGRRLAKYYTDQGNPASAEIYRENPSPRHEIAQAAKLFEDFTGKRATRIEKIPLEPLPKTGLAFGQLVQLGYISFRDGRPYRHTFRLKNSRPLLVATHDGKRVYLIGGSYAFTERGIEDIK